MWQKHDMSTGRTLALEAVGRRLGAVMRSTHSSTVLPRELD